jgi:hypothetical protein
MERKGLEMTKFSQDDGIEDKLTDAVGEMAKEISSSRSRNLAFIELRTKFNKTIKSKKYLVFTANVTNYGTWCLGYSRLFYVPETRRGALSIFKNKTIRLVCIGSGRFTRQLAAAVVKLEPKIEAKAIKQFKSNQEKLAKEKLENEPHLKAYLREMRIRGSNRSDGMIFIAAKEMSSMTSTWTEILALEKLNDENWQLHQGRLETIGSIYDLYEDKIYDKDGNFVLPKSYKGHRIVGLADGEFLLTNKFQSEISSKHFLAGDHKTYRPFLLEHDWMDISVFRQIP